MLRVRRALLGDHPRAWLVLAAPTVLALVLDLALRARRVAGWALQGKAIYGSSLLISAAFWILPLALSARLFLAREGTKRRIAARVAIGLFFMGFVMPLATFCFAGQALYHRVFDAYMGRDTVRLGIGLRGTVRDWFGAWGGPWLLVGMIVVGATITVGLFFLVRANATKLAGPVPLVPVVTFCAACVLFWTDQVDSRFLQAATPDACFIHGATHALRVTVTGKGELHQGMSLRTPAPMPPLSSARARPPNVVVVFLESVRADALCSDPPPLCRDTMLDDVAPDRIPLGALTTQTPNTFSASMILWTGLAPNVDFKTAHEAPVLWELARAVGYRTAYVSAQNPEYEDFGAFVRNAGIDVLQTALDLGGMAQEQLGAPDERATAAALMFARSGDGSRPYFAFLHLSNTHAPYRTDPTLLPFQPESATPVAPVEQFHNHYMNSVRLEARIVADFLRALRATPNWERTVVVVLADHGEQFREHGGLYHNHSLYDEELRIPGFVVAGGAALTADERAALSTFAGQRTYMQDVHETLVDLFGLEPSRTKLPFTQLVAGRSLLHPRLAAWEPMELLATSTGVWEPDDPRFGVMRGDHVLVGEPPTIPWSCFDLSKDPLEHAPLDAAACGAPMVDLANRSFTK